MKGYNFLYYFIEMYLLENVNTILNALLKKIISNYDI